MGGRIQFHADNLRTVTADGWVLRSVREGVFIDFIERPCPKKRSFFVQMYDALRTVGDEEVRALLAKRAIVECMDDGAGFVSVKVGMRYRLFKLILLYYASSLLCYCASDRHKCKFSRFAFPTAHR